MKAKKSLGQNFLRSGKAVKQIVSAGQVQETDTILEIGPGEGVLTERLLATGALVIAIEKDDRLIIHLNERFQDAIKSGQFILIHGDVLDLVGKDVMSPSLKKLLGDTYKLIANIPYYITGEIIERFHTIANSPKHMVLLVQKEVAERIIAKPIHASENGKESILSIAVKMYGTPRLVAIVPSGAFHPAPKVDSAILSIDNIKHFAKMDKEKEFFDLLHASFAHKRKIMLSNIKIMPKQVQEKVANAFSQNNLDSKIRAEDIPVRLWKKMLS